MSDHIDRIELFPFSGTEYPELGVVFNGGWVVRKVYADGSSRRDPFLSEASARTHIERMGFRLSHDDGGLAVYVHA